jgi:hypothetical protein
MSSDADKAFDLVANKLRKKKGLCPPTPEEAAAAFKKAKEIPLTRDEKDAIIEAMLAEEWPPTRPPALQERESGQEDKEIEADALAIFRNPGEANAEADRREAEMDEELLKDDDDEI